MTGGASAAGSARQSAQIKNKRDEEGGGGSKRKKVQESGEESTPRKETSRRVERRRDSRKEETRSREQSEESQDDTSSRGGSEEEEEEEGRGLVLSKEKVGAKGAKKPATSSKPAASSSGSSHNRAAFQACDSDKPLRQQLRDVQKEKDELLLKVRKLEQEKRNQAQLAKGEEHDMVIDRKAMEKLKVVQRATVTNTALLGPRILSKRNISSVKTARIISAVIRHTYGDKVSGKASEVAALSTQADISTLALNIVNTHLVPVLTRLFGSGPDSDSYYTFFTDNGFEASRDHFKLNFPPEYPLTFNKKLQSFGVLFSQTGAADDDVPEVVQLLKLFHELDYRRYGMIDDEIRTATFKPPKSAHRPHWGPIFWFLFELVFRRATNFNICMMGGAWEDDDGGFDYEELTRNWVDNEYPTFSMKTLAYFDLLVVYATVGSWEAEVGFEWRERLSQADYIRENYERDDIVQEFKAKLADRRLRFSLVDRNGNVVQ